MHVFRKGRAYDRRGWALRRLHARKQNERFTASARSGETNDDNPFAVTSPNSGSGFSRKRGNRLDDIRRALISRLQATGSGTTEEIKNVADELRRRGLLKDAWDYVKVLSPLGKARLWREALQIGQELTQNSHPPNIIFYNTLISACEKGESWEGALALLSEARQQHLEPNVISYNSSISACEKGSQWQRGLQLFAELQEQGQLPTIVTYSAAISSCGRSVNWSHALVLWSNVKAMQLETDTIVYNAMISACEKASEWERALILLSEMQQISVSLGVISFSALISACGHASRWQRSIELLQEMPTRCLKPNLITMNAAITACRSCDRPDTVIGLLTETRRLKLSPDKISYGAAITACEPCGMWETALSLFREMSLRCVTPDIIAYNALLGVFKAAKQWQRSLSLIGEFQARGHYSTSATMKAVISTCAHGLQWRLALQFLTDAVERRLLTEADLAVQFAEFARICNDLQHLLADDLALENVLQWEATLHLLGIASRSSTEPTWEFYSSLILQLLLSGLEAQAMTIYREAVEKALIVPWDPTSSPVPYIVDLHNHWPEIAELAVRATLLQHFLHAPRSAHGQLVFITGRGIHSSDGQAIVRPAVIELLHANLRLDVNLENPGRVIVPGSSLCQLWLRLGG